MSTDKSIAETGYTVFAAENGGVIVEGKGVNSCKNFAFSNAREFLEFLCRQHTGVGPLCFYGPQREEVEAKKAEQGLTDGSALADNLIYSPPPKTMCEEYSARIQADEFFVTSLKASLECEGLKPAFELIHRGTRHVWKIYEDGRTEGFPEDCFIINRISTLNNITYGKGYNAGMKWNTE